jgi:hypothetical protein
MVDGGRMVATCRDRIDEPYGGSDATKVRKTFRPRKIGRSRRTCRVPNPGMSSPTGWRDDSTPT